MSGTRTLSSLFNQRYESTQLEQKYQARTAFISLLGAIGNNGSNEIQAAIEQHIESAPILTISSDSKAGTILALEIGKWENEQRSRTLTLRFTHNNTPVLIARQARQEWHEPGKDVTLDEGALEDLLTLSAAMASARASFDPEAVRNRPNNPMLQRKEAASFGEALGKAFTQIRAEKGAHAHQVLVNILEKLDRAEKGEIREALRAYDRLSLFSYREGDLSIGLQIGPRGKQDAPRTVMLSVHRQDIPILEVSQTKRVWDEPFTEENPPAFHTGTLQTLLDLSSALNNPEALSKASMQEAPRTLALA